jgi:Spy/CpxP family protein refolding chaperone
MVTLKIKPLVLLAATLFFSQNVLASTGLDAIGTGSAGSYSHGKSKGEGSKTKTMPRHISGNAAHHNLEGISSKKPYSIHGGKEYSHKKSEGSQSKSHSYGKSGHGKNSHSYKGYSHKKSEGSQSKSHSYGKSGHGKNSHPYKGGYGNSYGHKKISHGGHEKSPFKHVMDYKHKLGLSNVQIETMKKLDVDFKKKIIQAKADHQIAHMELDLQVHSGKVDEAEIRAAGEKIVASKTNKIMAMIDAKIQLLNLLTADQRYKMAKMH